MLLKNLIVFLFLLSFQLSAKNNFDLSAFGTFGIVLSDGDRHGYRKDISYDEGVHSGDFDLLNHSLLGLQLDYSLSPDIDLVSQAVLRDMPEVQFDRYITLAFLRYAPTPSWQIRVGRTAPDLFLITEFRDVDYATAWATTPNEVYGILPFRATDGVDVSYLKSFREGTLRIKAFTGVSESVLSTSLSSLPIEVDDLLGLSVTYEHFNWSVRAQHSQVRIANENKDSLKVLNTISQLPAAIWPNSEEFRHELALKGKHATYSSVSGQLYSGNYLLTTELSRVSSHNHDHNVIPNLLGGYISLAHQTDEHTLYGVYSFTNSDNYQFNEPNVQAQFIPELISGIEDIYNFYASKQRTISLGWRWDVTDNIASSLQWNHTQIDDNGGTLWMNKSGDFSSEKVNVLMLSVSFSL